MAAHQHKRPYAGSQPSITSYFAPQISPTDTTKPIYSITPSSAGDPRVPALPAHVQANLISVGMRVRKSVPEGYKTGSYSAFTLFSDPSPPATLLHQVKMRPRPKELSPFCGIMNVGGMASQPYADDEEDHNQMPSMSQGSTISNISIDEPIQNKRRFFEEDEEDWAPNQEGQDVTMLRERPIAVPRRRKDFKTRILGQENLDDFGDADFLDYGLIMDDEMGDV